MKKKTCRLVMMAGAAVLLAAGGVVGGIRMVRWIHDRDIEARLDRYQPLIARHAADNGLDARFVRAVIRTESGGDSRAVSSRGASGLMQLMPSAEQDVRRWLGLTGSGNLFDPDYNIRIGTAYLARLRRRFGDDRLALAAYNMGPSALQRLRQAHPELGPKELIEQYAPAETRAYCRAILGD